MTLNENKNAVNIIKQEIFVKTSHKVFERLSLCNLIITLQSEIDSARLTLQSVLWPNKKNIPNQLNEGKA